MRDAPDPPGPMTDEAERAPRASLSAIRDARLTARLTEALAELAPPGVWRLAVAFGATFLSVVTVIGGMLVWEPFIQAGLLGGVCASLIAPSRRSAAFVAATATFVAVAIGPTSPWFSPQAWSAKLIAAATAALVTIPVAFVAKSALRSVKGLDRWLVWAAVGFLAASAMIAGVHAAGQEVTIYRKSIARTSLFKLLDGTVVAPAGSEVIDPYMYLQVVKALKRGEPFYKTFYAELGSNRHAGTTPGGSVFNYHLPTPFYFWAALPGSPVSMVYAYVVLVGLAVLSVPWVIRGSVRLPLAIPGAAAVGAYTFAHGGTLMMLNGEPWAGLLAILAVAAWARSSASARWKVWTVVAVVLGVLAPLVREPAVLVLIAGVGSALLVRDEQRPFRLAAWMTGLVVFGGCYLAHYLNVRPLLQGPAVGATFRLMGPDTIISALTFDTPAMGDSSTLALVLGIAGLLGIPQIKDRRTLTFAGIAVFSSLLAYLVVSNQAIDLLSGKVVNYWGMVIVPIICACVPAVLAVVPSMAPAAPPTVEPEEGDPEEGGPEG